MRGIILVLLAHIAVDMRAQHEFGLSFGGYLYDLNLVSERPVNDHVSSAQSLPFTASIHYRDLTSRVANFFSEVSYFRRVFHADVSSGGLGGGVNRHLDLRLDHLYATFGPEFGTPAISFRLGLQFGALVHSRQEGWVESWSMVSGSHQTILPPSRASDFKGDIRLLAGFRISRPLGESWGISIDPFVSMSLGSMLNSDAMGSRLRSNEAGLRIGLFSRSEEGAFWKAFRAGAPEPPPAADP